ncbi:MAG: group 1 truncated hemoglobin [Thiohalomonadaceae bacterium]
MTTSLYERLGGAAAVDAAVDIFYDKVLADARINHFFTNTDMARQRQHQKMFLLTYAFGGMPGYSGRSMRQAHAPLVEKLGLNDSHFDAVLENIAAALTELKVPAALIAEAAAIAESVRNDVLCK